MDSVDILVIGGDAAGMSAASQARRISKEISITVLEKTEDVSYAACGMPYFISGIIKNQKSLHAIDKATFAHKKNIYIQTSAEALHVDPEKKIVTYNQKSKNKSISYNKLIIATGAAPFIPPIPGIDNQNIFTLRALQDSTKIKDFINQKKPKKAIIIGGGFIGLEMAEAFHTLHIQTTVLEKAHNVATTMSTEIGEIIKQELIQNNINVITSVDINNIERKNNNSIIVKTNKGDFESDFIIVSIGIRPNTSFIKNSEISLHETGAILVDEHSKTNLEDIYAAGDCATVANIITNKPVYMPLGTTANKQGRVAGLHASGITNEKFKGIVGTQLVKVCNLEIAKTGFNQKDAENRNIPCKATSVKWKGKAGYWPDTQELFGTMTIETENNTIIGCELVGTESAALRINSAAVAIMNKMKIEDVAYLDLGYAPPFSPVWDIINALAQQLVVRKK